MMETLSSSFRKIGLKSGSVWYIRKPLEVPVAKASAAWIRLKQSDGSALTNRKATVVLIEGHKVHGHHDRVTRSLYSTATAIPFQQACLNRSANASRSGFPCSASLERCRCVQEKNPAVVKYLPRYLVSQPAQMAERCTHAEDWLMKRLLRSNVTMSILHWRRMERFVDIGIWSVRTKQPCAFDSLA